MRKSPNRYTLVPWLVTLAFLAAEPAAAAGKKIAELPERYRVWLEEVDLIIDKRERQVFLEKDFKVGPGPKFHVYLVPKEKVRQTSDVKDTMYVDLGRLRAFEGSQKYAIPAGVNLKDYPSVVIWCAQFGVLISPADLSYGGA